MVRLQAEAIRDRMLYVSGSLEGRLFGKPEEVSKDVGRGVVVSRPQTRRSIYVRVQRSQPLDMLRAFDAPVMETNCERRSTSTVATQSLMMLNGEFTLQHAAKLAKRAINEVNTVKTDSDLHRLKRQFDRAWQLALCRKPTADERRLSLDFAAKQLRYLKANPSQLPKKVPATQQVLTNLCQVLLSSNEFLYVD